MVMLGLLSMLLSPDTGLHEAFRMTEAQLTSVWERGWAEGKAGPNPDKAIRLCQRGIGKIRTAPLREETVSWLYFLHPRVIAYAQGYLARKQYWGEDEIQRSKDWLKLEEPQNPRLILFWGSVVVAPSFGGPYGTIDRKANARDLQDIRVVLQVGNRTYQPLEHPGDLKSVESFDVNMTSRPRYSTGTITTNTTGSAHGSGGYVYGSANSVSHYTTRTIEVRGEPYYWYNGEFAVAFELFDKDGTARITPKDKEFTVVVVYRHGERRATYKLDEWKTALEK